MVVAMSAASPTVPLPEHSVGRRVALVHGVHPGDDGRPEGPRPWQASGDHLPVAPEEEQEDKADDRQKHEGEEPQQRPAWFTVIGDEEHDDYAQARRALSISAAGDGPVLRSRLGLGRRS